MELLVLGALAAAALVLLVAAAIVWLGRRRRRLRAEDRAMSERVQAVFNRAMYGDKRGRERGGE